MKGARYTVHGTRNKVEVFKTFTFPLLILAFFLFPLSCLGQVDTTMSIRFWNITERTGEIIPVRPDTFLTDYFNRTNPEGQGLAVGYLGNLGSPLESRIFFEREDRSQFMFADAYRAYKKTPDRFNFINTKIPYSTLAYQRAGSREIQEERFQGLLAINVGKKLNLGFDVDYLYARGYYKSQSAKNLEWVLFANYLSDRHQAHVYINPSNYINAENGGITDDNWIAHPDYMDSRLSGTRDIPTRLNNTWNQLKGNRAYLNYRYNLGFDRDSVFIPVSSVIFTLDYQDNQKKFYTTDSTLVASYYQENQRDKFQDFLNDRRGGVNDSTYFQATNLTAALSLREGFSQWAKFDLTAFLTQSFRNFTSMGPDSINREASQTATYIGGELAKRTGKILRYNAQGSFGVLGYNLGDLNLSGTVETRIPFWGDTATVQADAYLKNWTPTYYENNYYSRYFQWENNDFKKVKKVYIGGSIDVPHTKTNASLGVENVTNYIYFNSLGYPQQHESNIQIVALRLNQNFKLGLLHWDNQLVYQKTSDPEILPLPDLAACSSLYLDFKIAKVLTIQMGANVHYWTNYYAPTYEPATQQFKLQDETGRVKVGNYPLVSGFLNCHLKQTRFFVEYYNLGSTFINPPEYFSLPHYPVNPAILKLGLCVHFIN